MAGFLAVVLTVASFLGGEDQDVPVRTETAAAGSQRVSAQAIGSPTAVRELLSETTSTLVEATGSSTSTTAPTTSTTVAPTTETTAAAAPEATTSTTEAPASTTTQAPRTTSTEAPATTAAPTTAAPTTSPPTTAAPTTTTTAPPPQPSSSSDEAYAYDDPRSTQVWYDLAECESGGNWSIDTGNGYYGGLQFSLATWESVGGTGYPHQHPAATQIEMGRRLQARQGWGAWPHCSEELGLH